MKLFSTLSSPIRLTTFLISLPSEVRRPRSSLATRCFSDWMVSVVISSELKGSWCTPLFVSTVLKANSSLGTSNTCAIGMDPSSPAGPSTLVSVLYQFRVCGSGACEIPLNMVVWFGGAMGPDESGEHSRQISACWEINARIGRCEEWMYGTGIACWERQGTQVQAQ